MRVNRELGRSPFTSPANAQAHLRELHESMSWDTLASVTGVPFSNLIAIYHGKRTKIRHETEAKILAVSPPSSGDPGQYIDITSSTRRVRALCYVGHSYARIAKAANSSPNRIASIANGSQPSIRRDLANRIAAAYPRLAFSPPPANKHTSRTRNVARAKQWHGPLAWSDIDDPACRPEEAAPFQALAKHERDPDKKAEIEHLHLLGESVSSIAKQLGDSEKYIRDQLAAILRQRDRRAQQTRTPHPQTEQELAA
jgi:hypothetical protein